MRRALTHASEGSEAMQASTAEDQESLSGHAGEKLDGISVLEADVLSDGIDGRLVEALSLPRG